MRVYPEFTCLVNTDYNIKLRTPLGVRLGLECRTLSNEVGIKKIIYYAINLYIGYINESTNFAESQGGGGSDTKDWGREKDEDEIEWIRRCLRQATRMIKPRKDKGLSR